jgi:nucleoside-diphosphate-sugar epimerase
MRPGSVFIYASTKDVYGTHASETEDVNENTSTEYCGQTAFEWSKLIGEHYVQYYARQNEFRACIFRMSTVFARPSEGNDFGFVTHYVDDFSRACRTFMNREVPFGIYNLGGGRLNAVSLRGIIDKVSKMIEIEPVIEEDPRIPTPSLRYVSDLTKINNELDWRPQIGVNDGLRVIL